MTIYSYNSKLFSSVGNTKFVGPPHPPPPPKNNKKEKNVPKISIWLYVVTYSKKLVSHIGETYKIQENCVISK